MYRRYTDGGATFSSTVNLSNNAGDSFFQLSLPQEIMYMWCGMMTHQGILKFCIRDRLTVELHLDTINLSNNAGISLIPAIAYYDTKQPANLIVQRVIVNY
jgi:hypothetical protein